VELTIVVGTGRCGSTMLSRVLHLHPEVLSVAEFFSSLAVGRELPVHDMDGQELWGYLSRPAEQMDGLIRDGLRPPELRYPYGWGRFDVSAGVPVICHCLLPNLTDDPDWLYDKLAADVPSWPRRTAADQYRAFFRHLAVLLGRRIVVERSGASLPRIRRMRELFPEARFVHLHRDGPDCALSMSRHPSFRWQTLAAAAVLRSKLPLDTPLEQVQAALPERLKGLICPPYDSEKFMSYPIPVALFGERFWSWMVREGVDALREMPAGTWTSVKYEQLLANPETELTRLAGFIGVAVTPRWLATARELMDPSRTGQAAARLDPQTLASLRRACEPGTKAILASTGSAR
jgi:hypothetical protein